MPLSNQLPQDYQRLLLLVIEGKLEYSDLSDKVFQGLNPAWVTPISSQMREALWSTEPKASKGWWLEGLAEFNRRLEERPEIAAVFSVSGNGYIRQKAVNKWRRINSSFELALLLMRLNDWVEPIRQAAILKFEELMALPTEESGLTAETLIGCMDLILNPARFGRMGEVEFGVLSQLLNMHNLPAVLAEHIITDALDSAPRYLKLGLKQGLFSQDLPIMAMQGKHLDVRRIAVNRLLLGEYARNFAGDMQPISLEIVQGRAELARAALSDPSPAVRCVALSYIAEFKPEGLYKAETFRAFVRDKRSSIVERAIFGLHALNIDYVDEVRRGILGGDCSLHSFEILGRYGRASDGDVMFNQLAGAAESHRVGVLGAAARLGHAASKQALGRLLFETEDVNEARAVAAKLYASDYRPDIDPVIKAIRSGEDLQARGIMRLIRRLPTMALALAISELIRAGTEFEEKSFWQLLEKKRNAGMFAPSEDEVSQLRKSAERTPGLTEKFYRMLSVRL